MLLVGFLFCSVHDSSWFVHMRMRIVMFGRVLPSGACAQFAFSVAYCFSPFAEDISWKHTALEIIRSYTEQTDGSWIEDKEFAIVWHYEQVRTHAMTLRMQALASCSMCSMLTILVLVFFPASVV
jgi:hypothetical protein